MAAHNLKPKTIIITGASNGIGAALAKHYAAQGITLGLIGRNKERLNKVAQTCKERGATTHTALIDVTDREQLTNWIQNFDDDTPVDLIIANAGISAGTGGDNHGETINQVRSIFDVNLHGVLNTIDAVQERMIMRGTGQIAITSSLAGFRGWPGAPPYCASKAAVKTYGEALRGALKKTGVKINVICPGFIKSSMTDANDFPMPFLMDTEKAARIIAKGLEKNKGQIAFPIATKGIVWFSTLLPYRVTEALLSFSPSKRRKT